MENVLFKKAGFSWHWKIRNRDLVSSRTLLMGVLNVTPDSFSDGGEYLDPEKALQRAQQMVREGADIIDIGAESTRPGAREISAEEEWGRLYPVLKRLAGEIELPISVDTTKPIVAKAALELGVHILNDVGATRCGRPQGGHAGPPLQQGHMAELARDFGAGLVLMHRRGTPETMQSFATYDRVSEEVVQELQASVACALSVGVSREQLVIDPGLGFAKTAEQNLKILSEIEKFRAFDLPILLGPSRKSFIGQITGRVVSERQFGTAAVASYAAMKGIEILRVHEVSAIRDSVRMIEAINMSS